MKLNKIDICRAAKQLAFVSALSFAVFHVEGCNRQHATRHNVIEYASRDGVVTDSVVREYVAIGYPRKHGDYLVFEDSASHFLVRVRFNRAALSAR